MSITYDAGALIAAERGDVRMRSRHTDALEAGLVPVVPADVVWQVCDLHRLMQYLGPTTTPFVIRTV